MAQAQPGLRGSNVGFAICGLSLPSQQRVEKELLEANLAELRQAVGVTQVEAAEAAEMPQSELSRLERRPDHLVSTLRRYVEPLGGELEVTAVVGKKRVRLKV